MVKSKYCVTVFVRAPLTTKHNVTVPGLDEIEQKHAVAQGVCTFVGFQLTPCYGVNVICSFSANTMLARGDVPALGPITEMTSVIGVLRYPRCETLFARPDHHFYAQVLKQTYYQVLRIDDRKIEISFYKGLRRRSGRPPVADFRDGRIQ